MSRRLFRNRQDNGDIDGENVIPIDPSIKKREDEKVNAVSLSRESSLNLSDLTEIGNQDDDDDEAIMNMSLIKKVIGQSSTNLSVNEDEEAPFSTPSYNKSNRKVSFTGVESLGSGDSGEKTYDQLLDRVGKMKAKVEQYRIDLSAEKAIRKKKEKSLIKLAKELTKRAKHEKEKGDNIEMLKNAMATLQGKIHASRSEMDDRIAATEKKTKEYNEILDQAHEKYRLAISEHDEKVSKMSKQHSQEIDTIHNSSKQLGIECERLRTKIGQIRDQYEDKLKESEKVTKSLKEMLEEAEKKRTDLINLQEEKIAENNEKHSRQTDDLRQQLLTANLNTDKIRTELASLQIKESPANADEIVSRTITSAQLGNNEVQKEVSSSKVSKIVGWTKSISLILVILLIFSYLWGLNSMNSICSPVKPGTTLVKGDIYEAPWWAPNDHKKAAFSLCGDRPRTSLAWNGDKLFAFGGDASEPLLKKRAHRIIVDSNSFKFLDKRGNIQSLEAPWSRM